MAVLSPSCTLCSVACTVCPIVDGENVFCCPGCRAVFNILSAKNAVADFSSHPIFLQALKTGVISNPELLERIRSQKVEVAEGEKQRLYLEIKNMWCASCAEVIRLATVSLVGVVNCVVDYTTDLACIEYSPRYLSKEQITEVITSFGYEVGDLDKSNNKAVSFDLYLRFIVAAFCSLNIMMLAYPLYATYFSYDGEGYGDLFSWLSLAASLPILLYSGMPIWRRFFHSLRVGLVGMEALVTIGVWAAFAFSLLELWRGGTSVYFDSMSVVVVFVLLGRIVESKAKFSAKESLVRLSRSTPRRGRKIFSNGSIDFIPVKEAVKGDIFAAYTGEKVVLDGVVTSGEGACDESLMTGESVPVQKKEGASVLAGSVLVQGNLQYKVTCTEEETALQHIINMVEQDIGHKSSYVRAADHIVRWFVPAVIVIALVCGVLYMLFPNPEDHKPAETALLTALAILLISCPCAIGIAAPTAESYLLNGLATMGVIVRNRGCLELFGKENVILFDKTGTVTEGVFRVHSGIKELCASDQMALQAIANRSIHPVAIAVAAACQKGEGIVVSGLHEIMGNGLKGFVGGDEYLIGSEQFLKGYGINVPDSVNDMYTHVYVAKNQVLLTTVRLGDNIRPGFLGLIKKLAPVSTMLLSGDREGVVATVASAVGFDAYRSQCSPMQKRDYVEHLRAQGKIVAMVGDGINDAPALTAANIGISVVSATDMSIQVSDILLTTSNLEVLARARLLAKKGRRLIRQNLFWAFFYNVIGIGLACFGVLTPVFAAAAMSLSSLTVLFNAKRLRVI